MANRITSLLHFFTLFRLFVHDCSEKGFFFYIHIHKFTRANVIIYEGEVGKFCLRVLFY
nr:MAG TPA: hypothetical protein [Caudoviricetes sp.]